MVVAAAAVDDVEWVVGYGRGGQKVEVTVEGRSVGTTDRPDLSADLGEVGVGFGRRETETQLQT